MSEIEKLILGKTISGLARYRKELNINFTDGTMIEIEIDQPLHEPEDVSLEITYGDLSDWD